MLLKPIQTPVSFARKRSSLQVKCLRSAGQPFADIRSESHRERGNQSMSCDERAALLAGQRGRQPEPHIILLPNKDTKDYEPVFTTADYSYGLSLEELLPFTWDPWWQRARRLCFSSLCLTFVLTLLTALSLAYYHDNATICLPVRALATTMISPPVTLALATNGSMLLPG